MDADYISIPGIPLTMHHHTSSASGFRMMPKGLVRVRDAVMQHPRHCGLPRQCVEPFTQNRCPKCSVVSPVAETLGTTVGHWERISEASPKLRPNCVSLPPSCGMQTHHPCRYVATIGCASPFMTFPGCKTKRQSGV